MRRNDRLDRLLAVPGTVLNLGLGNVARKAYYTLAVRSGFHPVTRLRSNPIAATVFRAEPGRAAQICHPAWRDEWWAYGLPIPGTGTAIPDWHGKLGQDFGTPDLGPWWKLLPMPPEVDVKDVWEFSRMDWVLCMSQRIACGDGAESARLQAWLHDWIARNPPFRGRNWVCGQEAAMRVLHLVLAARLLRELESPEPALLELVEVHLRRIACTTVYAVAQRNNHASSEAAALFVGGLFLERHGKDIGRKWREKGRQLLESAVLECTCPDGTMSQYSPNYQRLFLDTLSVADLLRYEFGLPPFHERVTERLRACTHWLDSMVDPLTGDAANIGGNDGAMLLPIGPTSYRNFRPSLYLASNRFGQPVRQRLDDASRSLLAWLGLEAAAGTATAESRMFTGGGFVVAHGTRHRAILRLPKFRFRPAHADALHLDLWVNGRNIFRDSGSGRYSGDQRASERFPSTAAHSTVEFDGRSQMPKLARFLFGSWLTPMSLPEFRHTDAGGYASAGYRDRWGARHHRVVRWTNTGVAVTDEIDGIFSRATLRWHLSAEDWLAHHDRISSTGVEISICIDHDPVLPRLSLSPRSLHYGQIDESPMISIELERPSTVTTTVEWKE